jgi:hypothetical protein
MFKFIEKHLLSQVLAILVLSFLGFNILFILTAIISLIFYQFGFNMGLGRMLSLILNAGILYYFLKTKFADYLKASFLSVFMMNVYVNLGILFYLVEAWMLIIGILVMTVLLMLFLWVRKVPIIYLLTVLYTGLLSLYIMIAGVEI